MAIAESSLRYYYDKNRLPAEFDQILGWRQIPGSYSVKPMNTYSTYNYYINKLGLRNREINQIKPDGTKRIIILGDSFTYGFAVKNEDLFTTQLEKLLNNTDSLKYETINAGVPKYGTAQELLLMKELSRKNINGDIYILMMFTNDILDDLQLGNYRDLSVDTRQPGFALDNEGNLVLKHPPREIQHTAQEMSVKQVSKEIQNIVPEESLKHDIPEKKSKKIINLVTIKFIKERIGILLQTKPAIVKGLVNLGLDIELPRIPSVINGWYNEDIIKRGVPLMKALIKEIKKEAQHNGSELYVVLIPSPIQVNRDTYVQILKNSLPDNASVAQWIKEPARPQVITGRICRDLNIPFLDLLPIMIENKDKNLYIPGDGHFTKFGHYVVAKSLEDLLRNNSYSRIRNKNTIKID